MPTTFTVKGYDTFQHYRDRNPPWIKLYASTLRDYAFSCLTDTAKAHLMLIWLLASQQRDHVLPYDADWIRTQTGAQEPIDLDALVRSGFLIPDQAVTDDASEPLADRKQVARPEKEKEGETETETEKKELRKARVVHRERRHDWPPDYAEQFWTAYPRRTDRKKALASLDRIYLADTVRFEDIMNGLDSYRYTKPPDREWMHPSTFLNGERWNDVNPRSSRDVRNEKRSVVSAAERLFEGEPGDDQASDHANILQLPHR